MTSLCRDSLRSYPGRSGRPSAEGPATRVSLQLRRVGLARKYGTGPRKRSRAVQKSAQVIVPSRTYHCGREGPNDEVGEEPSFDSVRGTVPSGIDRIGVKREASPGEVRVVRMTLTNFVEPPGADPPARWCGEGGQRWPPLPDLCSLWGGQLTRPNLTRSL
jgi:hypothetical protein